MTMSQRMWKREQERRRRERIRRARRRRNCTITVLVLAILAVCIIVINANKGDKHAKPTPTVSSSAVPTLNTGYDISNVYTTNIDKSDINDVFYKNSAFAGNSVADSVALYGLLDEADFYTGVNIDLDNVGTTSVDGSATSVTEQFKNKKFDKVFLSFGENEIGKMSADEFKNAYSDFVEKIQEYQSNAKLYLIAIPPVTIDVSNEGTITKDKIKEFNRAIKSVALSKEVYYADSVEALGDNKDFLPSGVSADGINLNEAAVTDLLYFIPKKAYIPAQTDISRDEEEAQGEAAEKKMQTEAPKKTEKPVSAEVKSSETPEPTVNVLKDSVQTKKKNKEE